MLTHGFKKGPRRTNKKGINTHAPFIPAVNELSHNPSNRLQSLNRKFLMTEYEIKEPFGGLMAHRGSCKMLIMTHLNQQHRGT